MHGQEYAQGIEEASEDSILDELFEPVELTMRHMLRFLDERARSIEAQETPAEVSS